MSFLSSYLLSIAGVVVLFVVIELILPNGKTSKFIRSVLGIFLIFVIVSPLGKIKNLDFSDILNNNSAEYQLDYNYLYKLHLQQAEVMQSDILKILEDNGIQNAEVLVNIKKDSLNLHIESIFVDLSQTVISKNQSHIINYTTLKDIISKYASIEENKVVINE